MDKNVDGTKLPSEEDLWLGGRETVHQIRTLLEFH